MNSQETSGEDGIVPVHMVMATLKQGDIEPDDIMAARIKRLQSEDHDEAYRMMTADPMFMAAQYVKLKQIIAYTYQVCGILDADERILDVLADPEGATQGQIESMLPHGGKDV